MSRVQGDPNQEQARYWNEEGGERWVRYMDRLEQMLAPLSARLESAVDAQPGERVLDVGCGGGATSAVYADAVGQGGRVIGADVSETILRVARRRFADRPALEFVTADAASHPFEKESFDVVTSRFGVMFFPDPEAAFGHLRELLRPGGRLCFLCWRSVDDNPWMSVPARAAFEHLPPPERPPEGSPGPFSLADPERLRGLLSGAGFSAIDVAGVEEDMNLGDLDAALQWLSEMGPAARPMAEASASARERAREAIREALGPYQDAGAVRLRCGAWLARGSA